MDKIKYIFTDLDGTLFGEKRDLYEKIDEEIADVMNSLKQYGVELSIATGRDYLNAKETIEKNGIKNYEYIIGCNGAQIYSKEHNQLLYVRNFSDDEFEYFFKAYDYITKKYPFTLTMHCYTLGRCFSHVTFLIEDDFPNYVLGSIDYLYENYINNGLSLLPRKSYTKDLCKKAYKFSLDFVDYKTPLEKRIEIVNDLKEKFPFLSYSEPLMSSIEITPSNISKHSAISYLKEKYLKCNDNEIAVFGDGGNDLLMLESFQHSFTRSDAIDVVKVKANNIVELPASDFVGHVAKKIINAKNK